MITTAHVYATLFIHLGVILVAAAYFLVSVALFPGLAARATELVAQRPLRTLLLGLAVSTPWVLTAGALMSAGGPLGLLGVVLGVLWVLVALAGTGGLAILVGRGAVVSTTVITNGDRARRHPAPADELERAWPDSGGEVDCAYAWSVAARGGLVIALTWALPIAGWFVAMPVTLVMGVGCIASSLGRRSRPDRRAGSRPQPATPTPSSEVAT